MDRKRSVDDANANLVIRTDIARENEYGLEHLREQEQQAKDRENTSSPNSVALSTDEPETTSASTTTNNTSLSSSEVSANSTARTSTMTDREPHKNPLHEHHIPKTTILDLVSNTASSSALPVPFGFSISRKGSLIAVYSASNIWLINASNLPRLFTRILDIRRKPVALDILDDGTLLVVLSTPTKVDVYQLLGEGERMIEKKRTVLLENDSKAIALSPDGLVLATGHQYGIEVISLAPTATESDRRSVTCQDMDALQFSDDGRTLLATTYARRTGCSTVFTVHGPYDGPFTEEGVPIQQDVDKAWTSQILFPEKAMIARQAALLPDSNTGQVNELFAFDADEDSWGIYDLAGLEFTEKKEFLPDQQSWTRAEFLDDALPAVSPKADHVALALRQQNATSLWLYRLPDSYKGGRWAYEQSSDHSDERSPLSPCSCIPVLQDESSAHQEIAVLRWLTIPDEPNIDRLVAVGNLIFNSTSDGPMHSMPQSSAGVVVVMDFDRSKSGKVKTPVPVRMTYDLDNLLPGERLPEEDIEFEREVELVRTRTVVQRRAAARSRDSRSLGRSQTTSSREGVAERARPNIPEIVMDEETLEGEEAQAAFEAPYDHSQPRSQMSLQRAATVAAVAPANRRHLRALPFRPLEYRRADGLREFPHESDADNWVPPPPPYTPNADPPGPGALNISLTFPGSHPQSLPVPPVPPVPSVPPVPPVPAVATLPPVPAIPAVPALPAHTTVTPLRPVLTSQDPVERGSLPPSTMTTLLPPPALLHANTYPGPQSPVPRIPVPHRPQQSISQQLQHPQQLHHGSGTVTRRPSQRTAYQATHSVILSNRNSRSSGAVPPNPMLPSPQQLVTLERHASRRGNGVPRAALGANRRVSSADSITMRPSTAPQGNQSVASRSAMRRPLLPRLTTINSISPNADREVLSAPPRTHSRTQSRAESRAEGRAQSRAQSRLQREFTSASTEGSPGRRFFRCVMM